MDIALAIEKINPGHEYLLNHSQADGQQEIVLWRGPGKCPTLQELQDAWALCLADAADAERQEQLRQDAIVRLKADAAMADVVVVFGL